MLMEKFHIFSFFFGVVISGQHQDKHEYNQKNYRSKEILHIFWCGRRDSNSHGKPTRPSSVPVYQFQHDRVTLLYATINE